MSVPIHNLYDYLYQCLEKRFITAYFYPFGHKDIRNLTLLQGGYFPVEEYFCQMDKSTWSVVDDLDPARRYNSDTICKIFPPEHRYIGVINDYSEWMLFHDQEPLDYNLYEHIDQDYKDQKSNNRTIAEISRAQNLRWFHPSSKQKKWILVHSELNSSEVDKYNQNGMFSCAYLWGHALLARDWYRYAKYDPELQVLPLKKLFLVYALGKHGSRSYRKNFVEQLQHTINDYCQIGSFNTNKVNSDSSALYDAYDHNHTGISIVLETVFDQRIHLTEKTLRPLAIGHPFILAAGPHSLQYLKTYGFKTFSPWIDESYDTELDDQKRLNKIFAEMQRLSKLPHDELQEVLAQCRIISEHNKQIFFSEDFHKAVINEFISNVDKAEQVDGYGFDIPFILESRRERKVTGSPDSKYHSWIIPYVRHIRKGGTIENYVPPWED